MQWRSKKFHLLSCIKEKGFKERWEEMHTLTADGGLIPTALWRGQEGSDVPVAKEGLLRAHSSWGPKEEQALGRPDLHSAPLGREGRERWGCWGEREWAPSRAEAKASMLHPERSEESGWGWVMPGLGARVVTVEWGVTSLSWGGEWCGLHWTKIIVKGSWSAYQETQNTPNFWSPSPGNLT